MLFPRLKCTPKTGLHNIGYRISWFCYDMNRFRNNLFKNLFRMVNPCTMIRLVTAICLYLLFSSFDTKPKKFPEISYVTTTGQSFTNNDFKGKNTIVVLFHLGCPPAMSVLRDIE